jgi:hypothetical protein
MSLGLLKKHGATIVVAAGKTVAKKKDEVWGTNVILEGNGFKFLVGPVIASTSFVDETRCSSSQFLSTPTEVLKSVRECEPDVDQKDLVAGIARRLEEMR